ncbi:RebB family R body protein [Rheinheimera sp.]|uniref:RebB family R body protein n=1 Tax=Rheinheimera sp. TaxID=1869214 RepID=UPI00307D0223
MTELNSAVVQSLALVNAMTLGVAPAMAMGSQYQHLAYNLGLASMNQVFAQQQACISQQATSVVAVLQLYRP